MLKDILLITNIIFDEALPKNQNLMSPKMIYNIFRKLEIVIKDIGLVANHYLALDFEEEYLQSSSFGKPVDKWRYFFNKDLELLNEAIKEYLLVLSHLHHENMFESYLSKHYNCKSFYSFVRDNYNIGFVEPCGKELHINILNTNKNIEGYYLGKNSKIDLSIYESRISLKNKLNDSKGLLFLECQKLKTYILERYTIEDLLND